MLSEPVTIEHKKSTFPANYIATNSIDRPWLRYKDKRKSNSEVVGKPHKMALD